jgi:hypothetical protein
VAQGKSKADLESELDEAKDYIEQLEGKLDDIGGIAADEDEDEEEDEEDGGDSESENGEDQD